MRGYAWLASLAQPMVKKTFSRRAQPKPTKSLATAEIALDADVGAHIT